MNFDKDEWFKKLDDPELRWDSSMAQELAVMMESPALLTALGEINFMVKGDSYSLRAIDFTTQEGVAKAIKLQGRTQGMLDALQDLADKAEEGNEDG